MAEAPAKDPVCGMRLRPEEAVDVLEYGGRAYRFCSEACRKKFEGDPERFRGDGPLTPPGTRGR